MCGICFVSRTDNKPAKKMILKRYESQKSRGQLGFGYISIDNDMKVDRWGRAENQVDIEKLLSKEETPTILFHHRMPTSTPNFIEATHPIKVVNEMLDYDYYVVHNGIISNASELRAIHLTKGFKYTTEIFENWTTAETTYQGKMVFNDSEALAVELAQVIDGEKKEIDAKGSIAFIALQVNKETKAVKNIYFGRNFANPLKLERQGFFFSLTSEGGGDMLDANKLYVYDPVHKTFSSSDLNIGSTTWAYDKCKYSTDPNRTTAGYDTKKTGVIPVREVSNPSYIDGEPVEVTQESITAERFEMSGDDKELDIKESYESYLYDLYAEEEDLEARIAKAKKDKYAMLIGYLEDDLVKTRKTIANVEKLHEEEMKNENIMSNEMREVHRKILEDVYTNDPYREPMY